MFFCFFFSSRRRHTRLVSDWSSDVCSSDLDKVEPDLNFSNLRAGRVGWEELALQKLTNQKSASSHNLHYG